MNSIKELESAIKIDKVPLKFLLGIHNLSDEFPTVRDTQWEILLYLMYEEKDTFTVKSLGRRMLDHRIDDEEEQMLEKHIKILENENKIIEGERKDQYSITEEIYTF